MTSRQDNPHIVVIGLGYVGLPLAVALARNFATTGLDSDPTRIAELRDWQDRTGEVCESELAQTSLRLTDQPNDCSGADVYIITVPTPVDAAREPDLTAVIAASRTVGQLIDPSKRPLIVYESTVFPGVTENICAAEIEQNCGLKRGRDFRIGYSPERINPGDQEHRVDKIVKVVAGEDPEVTERMAEIYGAITSGGVFRAASIKVAEAAKAIENAQRDVNIAFINEVTQIFSKVDISIWDVLAAARTKWNFLEFQPGLVGGHCIGVDPYYLSHLAKLVGHDPKVILAGRETNDRMGVWIADALHDRRRRAGSALVMGLTFKENVPDLRNSRSFDLVNRLKWLGHEVHIADPLASPSDIKREYDLSMTELHGRQYDLVIGAVAHRAYRSIEDSQLSRLVTSGGTLADLKGMWRDRELAPSIDRWTL